METILHNLSEVFAVSIIHSLWQCMFIYLALRIVLGSVLRFSSAAKYNISIIGLYYVTLWFVYTLFEQAKHYTWVVSKQASFTLQPHLPLITTLKHFAKANDRYEITIEHYLPYITLVYVLGLIFHTLRLTSSWLQLRQLKQSTVFHPRLQQTINKFSAKLKLKKQVLVGHAGRIDIPCVAGFLKPIIMLPLSLTTYLSAKEVEAILLHELAHVKRNDYLVNLLQQVMSVIFFFNPFVYLINRMVNLERESACDDMVINLTDEPLVYAQALLKIEQNNLIRMPLALAATGNNYHLLNRIERIMKTKTPTTNLRHLALAFTILLASTISLAWLNPAIGNGKLSMKAVKPPALFNTILDTTRRTRKVQVYTHIGPNHKAIIHKSVWVSKDGIGHYYDAGPQDPKLEAMGKEMEAYGKQMDNYYKSADYKKLSEDMETSGKEMEAYYDNPAYKKLEEDMEKAAKAMESYYNNANYKKLQEDMEKSGKDMEAYYNNPQLKKIQEEQEKAGKQMTAAYGDGSDMDKVGKQMVADGKVMSQYYESAEFKKKAAELQKKYHVPAVYSYQEKDQDPNVKAYLQELGENKPQNVRNAQDEMKTLGKKMREHYQSPAIKAAQRNMKAMGDSMRNAYNNPKIKEQQENMRKLGEQMRAYSNSAEIKQLQNQMKLFSEQMHNYGNNADIKQLQKNMKLYGEQMRAYNNSPQLKQLQAKMKLKGDEMRAYTNSPGFKKKIAEWKKEMKWDWNSEASADVEPPAVPPVPQVKVTTPPIPPVPEIKAPEPPVKQ